MNTVIARLASWRGAVVCLRGWRRSALAFALGVLATLALPPAYILPVLIPAFSGLLWLVEGAAHRRHAGRAAFAAGWWFGFGHFLVGFYWIGFALLVDAERWGWLAPLAVPGIAAPLAVFPGFATWLVWRAGARGVGAVLVLGVAWTIAEWLRGHLFTGFPWNLIGYGWVWSDQMIQVAAVVGAYGLSLLTVVAAAMPAALPEPGRAPRRALGTILVCLAIAWGGGALRLALAGPAGEDGVPGVRLRIVQANLDQARKWLPESRDGNLVRHIEMTRSAGFAAISHVIWPETALTFFVAADPRRRRAVAVAVPPGGVVISGAPRFERDANGEVRYWNAIHAIDGGASVVATYDKFHLVPFGEYVPLRGILDVAKITHGRNDFSAGPGPRTLKLPGLPPVSPLICYEAIFPGQVLDPEARPGWLLNLTNDAWFGESAGPYQHLASARVRAVEEGLPLVRAANTGISAVTDAYGRTIARLGLGRRGVLDTPLPRALGAPPPYARYGDGILVLLLLLVVILAYRLDPPRRAP